MTDHLGLSVCPKCGHHRGGRNNDDAGCNRHSPMEPWLLYVGFTYRERDALLRLVSVADSGALRGGFESVRRKLEIPDA